MIDERNIEDDLTAIEFELAAAGDMAGAHMLGDILNGYREGSVEAGHAVLAIDSGHARLRRAIQARSSSAKGDKS